MLVSILNYARLHRYNSAAALPPCHKQCIELFCIFLSNNDELHLFKNKIRLSLKRDFDCYATNQTEDIKFCGKKLKEQAVTSHTSFLDNKDYSPLQLWRSVQKQSTG